MVVVGSLEEFTDLAAVAETNLEEGGGIILDEVEVEEFEDPVENGGLVEANPVGTILEIPPVTILFEIGSPVLTTLGIVVELPGSLPEGGGIVRTFVSLVELTLEVEEAADAGLAIVG